MESNSVSALTMALTMAFSSSASAQAMHAEDSETLASWPMMSMSTSSPSGRAVSSPRRAACRSFSSEETICLSVALAMPSSQGISQLTGTR